MSEPHPVTVDRDDAALLRVLEQNFRLQAICCAGGQLNEFDGGLGKRCHCEQRPLHVSTEPFDPGLHKRETGGALDDGYPVVCGSEPNSMDLSQHL